MKEENREKIIETIDSYDDKIETVRKDLKKLTDKRENFFTRTVSDNLKANNMSIRDFFESIDNFKETKESRKKADITKPNNNGSQADWNHI